MQFNARIRVDIKKSFSRALPLAAIALAVPLVHSQAVPVPFANTFAGGGTVCSASLPVYTVSGTGGAKYGDGCPATQATFNAAVAVATDALGNVYVADQNDFLIRIIYNGGTAVANAIIAASPQQTGLTPQKGNIYTIAGGLTSAPSQTTHYCNDSGSGPSGTDTELDGCPATQSAVAPRGLAVDGDGNVFFSSVASGSNLHVLYIGGAKAAALITLENPTITAPVPGYVYNIAGTTGSSFTGDGTLASKATVNTPRGIYIDANENVYFADEFNNAIRMVSSSTGFISTIAGHNAGSVSSCSAATSAGDGGSAIATTTTLACPYGPWLDQYGNIFIAEAGNGGTVPGRIRVVYEGGTLPGITAPTVGNIYTYAGAPPTAGGTAITGAQLTTFQQVFGVAIDPAGYLYVTDYRTGSTGSNKIWRIDPTTGNIATIAGNGGSALTTGNHCNAGTTGPTATDTRGDGCPATQAYLNTPQESVGFDAHGTAYVADRSNNVVRSFAYNNTFPATAVGSSVTQPLAFVFPATSVPTTEVLAAQGSSTTDYADAGGDTCALNTALPVTTTCVYYIKFAPTGSGLRSGTLAVSSTLSTTTNTNSIALNGIGTAPVLTINAPTDVTLATAIQPLGVSTDELGNVNISDGKGKQVLRTTIAGGTATAYVTGLGTPRETATDPSGNIFVADSTNNTIVERTPANTTATLGTGLSAPQGVAADLFGNIYVADTGNSRLVAIAPLTGNQRTIYVSGFTLSAPTYLALDPSGDLYVIDTNNTRLIELPLGGTPQLITLPNGATPTAIAFDPGGDLYLADKSSGNILFVPAGTTTAPNLITGLTTPVGVAVGPTGNVFVADSSATTASGYNFALNASTFTTTNITLTSLPVTLTLASVGNVSATLSTPTYVETGSASAFPSNGTPTCTAALVLATGATCTQTFVFSPTLPGPQSARVVFSDTTGQSVTANFNATATNLIFTTTTIAVNGAGPFNYGQTETYTVTLTPKSTGSAAPTGTITFVVDGTTNSTQSVSSNPYTFSVSLPIGTHVVAATYGGDAIYAGSNASSSITIGKAVTTTTASYQQTVTGTQLGAIVTPASKGALNPSGNVLFYVDGAVVATVPVGNGTVSTTVLIADGTHSYYATYVGDANYATSSSITQTLIVARAATTTVLTSTPVSTNGIAGLLLTAKVTTTATGTPTGTVTFTNGATTLAVVALPASGIATYTTGTTSYSNYSFTAAYSGDGLFDPSSSMINQGPDFVVITPTTVLTVPQGGQAVQVVTVAPINGYSGSLTAKCTNLPVNSVCTFTPIPVVLAGTASVNLSVEVFVGVNPNVGAVVAPALGWSSRPILAFLLLVPVGYGLGRRKRKSHTLPYLLALLLLTLIPVGLTGCGIKTPAVSSGTFVTPVGTTAVTVTLTDANGVSRSGVITVAVDSQ